MLSKDYRLQKYTPGHNNKQFCFQDRKTDQVTHKKHFESKDTCIHFYFTVIQC